MRRIFPKTNSPPLALPPPPPPKKLPYRRRGGGGGCDGFLRPWSRGCGLCFPPPAFSLFPPLVPPPNFAAPAETAMWRCVGPARPGLLHLARAPPRRLLFSPLLRPRQRHTRQPRRNRLPTAANTAVISGGLLVAMVVGLQREDAGGVRCESATEGVCCAIEILQHDIWV